MNARLLDQRIQTHLEHSRAVFLLDEELGSRHGIGWIEFLALKELSCAEPSLPLRLLAEHLGLKTSRLLAILLPLEKIGFVTRVHGKDLSKHIEITSAGRKLLPGASESAHALCAHFK